MSTLVVNVKHAPQGWRDDPQFVDVMRARNGVVSKYPGGPGYLGNPYKINSFNSRWNVLHCFRERADRRVVEDPEYREAVRALVGKTLVCCCVRKAGWKVGDGGEHVCHGQILAEIAERLASEVRS